MKKIKNIVVSIIACVGVLFYTNIMFSASSLETAFHNGDHADKSASSVSNPTRFSAENKAETRFFLIIDNSSSPNGSETSQTLKPSNQVNTGDNAYEYVLWGGLVISGIGIISMLKLRNKENNQPM